MFKPLHEGFSVSPICYRPMTVMLIDDDPSFLEEVAQALRGIYPVVTFTNPDEAMSFYNNRNKNLNGNWVFGKELDIDSIVQTARQEIYKPSRFQEIFVTVLDYEMPNKNAFDVIMSMGVNNIPSLSFHSYILLTGKRYADFNQDLANSDAGKKYISKWDPNCFSLLLSEIQENMNHTLLMIHHGFAITLAKNPEEKALVTNDGHFLPVINDFVEKNDLCELYLFDRQGSLLGLDRNGKPSWLFIRNEIGVKNSLQLAQAHNAPASVLKAIASKEYILSLYEKTDIENLGSIDWETYLLPAKTLSGDDTYTSFFNLEPLSPYYYAATSTFPAFPIDSTKILSYQGYLDSLEA